MISHQLEIDTNQTIQFIPYGEGKKIPAIKNKLEVLSRQLRSTKEFDDKRSIHDKIAALESDEAFSKFFMGETSYLNVLPPRNKYLIDNFLLLVTTGTTEYVWRMWCMQKDNLKSAIQLVQDEDIKILFLEKVLKFKAPGIHSEILPWFPMALIMKQKERFEEEFKKSKKPVDQRVAEILKQYIQKWVKPEPKIVLAEVEDSKSEVDDTQQLSINIDESMQQKNDETENKELKSPYQNVADCYKNFSIYQPVSPVNLTPWVNSPAIPSIEFDDKNKGLNSGELKDWLNLPDDYDETNDKRSRDALDENEGNSPKRQKNQVIINR